MKARLTFLTIFLIFLACNDNPNVEYESTSDDLEEVEVESKNPLVGAWELIGYYNYENDEVIDSFKTREGYRQVKIYSPTRVMWSKQVPSDSTEWFGYGNYEIQDGQLVEVLDYGSKMMSRIIEERTEFRYDLDIDQNSFSQIELDEDGSKIYSENYRRIE